MHECYFLISGSNILLFAKFLLRKGKKYTVGSVVQDESEKGYKPLLAGATK